MRPDFHLVALFMLESRPDIFREWPFESLRDWLQDRWNQRMMVVVEEGRNNVIGVGIGWRACKPDIDDPWTRWDDHGNCLYVSQLHAKTPQALAVILQLLGQRCPDWQKLTLYGRRHGKLRRLPPQFLTRLNHFIQTRI